MYTLPTTGFLRLSQIIGQPAVTAPQAELNRAAGRPNQHARAGLPALIPVCASTWWSGVRDGRYPQPIKIGRASLWRVEEIRDLIDRLAAQREGAK